MENQTLKWNKTEADLEAMTREELTCYALDLQEELFDMDGANCQAEAESSKMRTSLRNMKETICKIADDLEL